MDSEKCEAEGAVAWLVWLITSVKHLHGAFGFKLLMSSLFLFATLNADTYRNETKS